MAVPSASAFHRAALLISYGVAGLLLLGIAVFGANIFYLGAVPIAFVGIVLATVHLVQSPHTWREKVLGLPAACVNVGVAVWLWLAALQTWNN